MNYRHYCHFQAWKLYGSVKELVSLPSQGQEGGWILRIAYFLESYIGTYDWKCHNIRGRCPYVCRTKNGRKTRAFWGISWLHWIYSVVTPSHLYLTLHLIKSCKYIYSCMALHPLLGPFLPQRAPSFFSLPISSALNSYSHLILGFHSELVLWDFLLRTFLGPFLIPFLWCDRPF